MDTRTNTRVTASEETLGGEDLGRLEGWLRGSRETLLSPPSVEPRLLDRLRVVSLLLAEAGAVSTVPALVYRAPDGRASTRAVGDGLVVGRSAPADLQVADGQLSRRHFEIRCSPEGLMLTDLGSTNGTRVNGRRVTQRVLVSGDAIEAGKQLFVFTAPGGS